VSLAERRALPAILRVDERAGRYTNGEDSHADSKSQSFYGSGHHGFSFGPAGGRALITLTGEPWRRIETTVANVWRSS
jgi:hypothetical protein